VKERIVLAYSGGLDTSVAIAWLTETRGAEVVAVTMDLGQGAELADVRERSRAAGAVRTHVIDLRETFAREFVLPALQAGAVYEERYLLAAALARPLMARQLVEVARMESTGIVAHGSTGKGNGQARLDLAIRALDPSLTVLAPARTWGLTRSQAIAYAAERDIPVLASAENPYSSDANLWGRSISGGRLEDAWQEAPADVHRLTRGPGQWPSAAAYVELTFERGVPVAVNGVAMPFVELVETVGTIAGHHGVGRIDMVENRLLGIKSREIHEAPAAVVLHAAHRELERFVTTRELDRLCRQMGAAYGELVYNGQWFTPAREAIDAFVAAVQQRVTGDVRIRLSRGDCQVVGRRSPHAIYDPALATYEGGDRFDHSAAEGFVKIWGLPVEIAARVSAEPVDAAVRPRAATTNDQ
jgi:argininosuccinate synthase